MIKNNVKGKIKQVRSETKLKILRILFVISLIITILFISNTYAKYQENIATTYNIGIKKWNIKLEEQHFDSARGNNKTGTYTGVNDALKAGKTLSQIIEPTLIDSEYVSDNTIAPGREGYLEFDIDYSQVDVPFTFDFSFAQTTELSDFEIYAYSVDDVMYYNLPAGYRQLEYIGSTSANKQYIDTGILIEDDVNYILDTEIQFTATTSSRQLTGSTFFCFGIDQEGKFQVKETSENGENVVGTFAKVKLQGKQSEKNLYVNNELIIERTTVAASGSHKLYMFGVSDSADSTHFCDMNIKKYRLYKQNEHLDYETVGEFVPCYRTSDNKIGVYAFYRENNIIVDHKFITTPASTGELTRSEDIDGNPIVANIEDIVLNKDTDTQNKTNIKAYIRWDDIIKNQMDNLEDTAYTLENNTVNFNVEAVFTQYTETEEVE